MIKIHKVDSLPVIPEAGHVYLEKKESGVALHVTPTEGGTPALVKRKVHLLGPTSLFHSEVGVYTIQDYTDKDTYDISSTDGTVSRSGNQISFMVSNQVLTSGTFTVNGRIFTVALKIVAVEAPTILAPTDGSTGVPLIGTVVYASPFALNYAGATDTLVSADWELATDPEFTTIVASSYGDTVNTTSWPIPA